jgi:hypothetical protein
MGQWQPMVSQRLLDVVLDPSDELGVAGLPLLNPRLDVGLRHFEPAAIVKPSQFLQAIVVALSREMIDGIPQEVHVAALPGSTRQAFRNRLFQPFVVIRDHKLDAVETALLEPHQELAPARAAFPIGKLNA